MKRKRKILNHYEPRIDAGLENHRVLDWISPATQRARFGILVDNVELEARRLLDVGCGLGDLLGFLKERKIHVDYTGVDISEKMVQAAYRSQKGGRFVCADLFDESAREGHPSGEFPPRSYDVVFSSGVFNLQLGNNLEFLARAVERLMDLARESVVFNLLYGRTSHFNDAPYAYYNPSDVLAMLLPLGWNVRILDDYLPNDFTVISRRPQGDPHE